MIKVVVFDLDGTIYDSRKVTIKAQKNALNEAFKELGIKMDMPSDEQLTKQLGVRKRELYKGIFPEGIRMRIVDAAFPTLVKGLIELIKKREGNLIKGVDETLDGLRKRGLKIGLASNCVKEYLDAIISTYDLGRYFDSMMYIEELTDGKKSDLIRIQLERFNVEPKEAIMVGDRAFDIEAAKDAGCQSVGFLKGVGGEEELKNADFKINELKDTLNIVGAR